MTHDGDAEQMLQDAPEDVKAETSGGEGQAQTADQPNIRQVPVDEVKEQARGQFAELLRRGLVAKVGITENGLRRLFEQELDERLQNRQTIPVHAGNETVLVSIVPQALSTAGLFALLREKEIAPEDEGDLLEAIYRLDFEGYGGAFGFLFDINLGEDDGTETEERVRQIEESDTRVGLDLDDIAFGLIAFESFREAARSGYIAAIGSTQEDGQGNEETPEVSSLDGYFLWTDEDGLHGDCMPTAVIDFPDELEDKVEETEGEAAETEGPVDANP